MNNYAFIDGQNLYRGVKSLGWSLDFQKFRSYLVRHYGVTCAFYFIGKIDSQQRLYDGLQQNGYELEFKPVVQGLNHGPKGNVDAELVLHAMIEYPNYDQAVLVTGDGDFRCLADYLREQGKLRMVLAPNRRYCSSLLKSLRGARYILSRIFSI